MIKQIDVAAEIGKFDELIEKMTSPSQSWNINKIQPWHVGFRWESVIHIIRNTIKLIFLSREYVNKYKSSNETFENLIRNEDYFRKKLTQFLFSPKGAFYQVFFHTRFQLLTTNHKNLILK